MRAIGLIVVLVLMAACRPDAVEGVHDCDRLAANPPDPDRVTIGVERKDVDIASAIAACESAVAEAPEEARFS